jgi:hypothetical protein
MIITGIKSKDWDRYAHEVTFGVVSSLKQLRDILAQKQQVPAGIESLMGFKWKADKSMQEYALRVAFLYTKWQTVLDRMIADPALDKTHLKSLYEMKRCAPDGVFTDIPHPVYCRNYRVCPWCRYRKALDVLKHLGSNLKKTEIIAVAKIHSSLPESKDGVAGYDRVIRATCKERNKWIGDYVITLPTWPQDRGYINKFPGKHLYSGIWETTIIAYAKKDTPLVLPEDAVTPKARQKDNMNFSTPGDWVVWEDTTKETLTQALKYAMGYPLYMVSKQMAAADMNLILARKNTMRAVGHGGLQMTSD